MTDPTGFVPDASPIVFVVPDLWAPINPDPTGFVPPASPFTFVVPDVPGEAADGGADRPGRRPRG